jgi:hypothetical protein
LTEEEERKLKKRGEGGHTASPLPSSPPQDVRSLAGQQGTHYLIFTSLYNIMYNKVKYIYNMNISSRSPVAVEGRDLPDVDSPSRGPTLPPISGRLPRGCFGAVPSPPVHVTYGYGGWESAVAIEIPNPEFPRE